MKLYHSTFLLSLCLLLCLAACSLAPARPTSTPTLTSTFTSSPTLTSTASPTITPTFTPRTPPTLPPVYANGALTPYGTPHTYIPDTCTYLRDKWSSANSAPGTVVMVIMFHSISNDTLTNSNQLSEYNFRILMTTLHDDGFEAINTTQLAGFMETNAKIPRAPVLLVVDDRHQAQYFNVLFRQYWDKYSWPVVNAWISTDLSTADLWHQQEQLNVEGWVDYQAHGYFHNVPINPGSTDAYIMQELGKPIELFQQHFDKTPIAFIWPGGGFTPHAADLARQLGYRLGFTVNPRGPLMFDWVPLADTLDPSRPTWIAEGPVADPLMVLPRYWDSDAIIHLNDVIQVGQESAAYADQNKSVELEYYDIVCSPDLGPIP